MESIEERAKEYEILHIGHGKDFCVEDFILGAKSEHEELTRWHDPEDYPEHQDSVLLKVSNAEYNIGHYNTEAKEWRDSHTYNRISTFDFIGWREIHE